MNARTLVAIVALVTALATAAGAGAQPLADYDTFGAAALDPARWRGYEHTILFTDYSGGTMYGGSIRDGTGSYGLSGVENVETRRQIVDGEARLALTSVLNGTYLDSDHRAGHGRLGLRLSDVALADGAPPVRAMQTRVTIASAEYETACTWITGNSHASAGIVGIFFNDGSSTGPRDRTGDIAASVVVTARPGLDETGVSASLWRCSDPACVWIKQLTTAAAFDLPGRVGDPHVLTLRWQPEHSRFVATAKLGTTTVQRTIAYAATITPAAPVAYVYDLRLNVTPGGCTGPVDGRDRVGVAADARFDRVRLDADAAAAE